MDRGGGERPGAEKHGFDTPCTRFSRFCETETLCFIVYSEFPMSKTLCFLGVESESAKTRGFGGSEEEAFSGYPPRAIVKVRFWWKTQRRAVGFEGGRGVPPGDEVLRPSLQQERR